MIERRLSKLDEIKERYIKHGVAVFVFNRDGEVLLVQENTPNPSTGKKSGDYSVLCETSEEGEDWSETVIRAFKEELGITPEESGKNLKIDPNFCFLGESLFVEGVLARVVAVYWTEDKNSLLKTVGDGEIKVVGWEDVDRLNLYNLRPGVKNVLDACLNANLLLDPHSISKENLLSLSLDNLKLSVENLGE